MTVRLGILARIKGAWTAFSQGSDAFATPAVTNVQLVSIGQFVVVVAILLGVDLDSETQQLVAGLSALAVAVLPASDAAIRRARTKNAAGLAAAKAGAAGTASDGASASATPGANGDEAEPAPAPQPAAPAPSPISDAERELLVEGLRRLR